MSAPVPTLQNTKKRNLVRISGLAAVLALPSALFEGYQAITTQNWIYLLVPGALLAIFVFAVEIIRSRNSEKSRFGAWHLIVGVIIVMILLSALRANIGTDMGAALLIISLILSIQTLPPKQVARGAAAGVFASLLTSALVFYSPLPQIVDLELEQVAAWASRATTFAVIILMLLQFRTLTLASKLLVSFLSTVALISMAYNIVTSISTTQSLTDQVGQQLQSVAEGRGFVIGDYLNGQANVLQTLALDETIRQGVRAANALKPSVESIQDLDQQWRQGFESGSNNSLINSRLSNSLSNDLRVFQALAPEHIEVFVTDQTGALVSATNVTSDYYQADEAWWISTYQEGAGDVYISQPEYDESAEALSILIAVPIYDTRQGGFIGVLRSTIAIDRLVSVLRDPIGETGEVDIFFPGATMLDTRDGGYENIKPDSMVAIQNLADTIYLRTLFEDEDRILSQGPIQSQDSTAKVNELGWKVIASQDTEEALAPVREQVRLVSFFSTIMTGVAALLSLIVSQRLAQPIINLTEAANKVASGNLNTRASVESQDETGQLADTFNTMTTQLQEMLIGLEERVAERTSELEESSQQLEKRSAQFETIAQLARTINSIQDPGTLLHKITQLVSVSFGFYHTGLFLLDESRQYAVLSAANSEGGQKMLDRKHRLGVGQTGIVGYVTSTGNPRIALDTGADAVFFDNPDLPETRSEMALPLRVGTSIVGALDVQSTKPNAFSEEDVEVLSILADVVSVAIENARLFEESQRVLAEAQTAFSESTLEAWRQLAKKRETVGYTFSGALIRPLEKRLKSAEIREAVKTGKIAISPKNKKSKITTLAVPIKLRNQVIGTMNISLPEDKEWEPDEVDITQALAERVGVAVENATLLEGSQRAAAKEQAIGEITGKISSSVNLRNVLQTAVEELGRSIPGSEIVIELAREQDKTQRPVTGE
jgi:GAF domain-containing protein/HAMP domain-containing protein